MNTRRQITDKPRPMYVMILRVMERFSGNEVGFKSCNRGEVRKAGVYIVIISRHKTNKEYSKVAQLSALAIFSPIGTGYLSTSSSVPSSKLT